MSTGKKASWVLGLAVVVALLGLPCEPVEAQDGASTQKPRVARAIAHDTSRPLRDMVRPLSSAQAADETRDLAPRDNPRVRERYQQENRVRSMNADPLRQIVTAQATAPDPIVNFDGPSGEDTQSDATPVDANGDVGPNHWISMANLVTTIYNKDGSVALGPFGNGNFWDGFGEPCYGLREPIVLYDQLADRWMVSQDTSDVQCVAVSTGSDPTGTYHRYAFRIGYSDFPQLGLWPDGYYLSFNDFLPENLGGRPASSTFCSFERDAMLEGDEAQMVCFDVAPLPNGDEFWLPQPAHLEGMTLPPTGGPHPFIMAYDDEVWGGSPDATQDFYKVWHFGVDWNDAARSTLTGPIDVPTAEFNANQCGVFGSTRCVPQPDTNEMVDSLALFTSYRAVYRNFSAAHADGAHDSLWVNHTVNVDGSGPPGLAGIRWAEVRDPLGNPAEHQAGTWSPPDGDHRFVGSLSVDDSGNMLLAYSVSSEHTFPSIRYAGRLASDPLGELTQEENELWAGTGSQFYYSGWGDFSTVSLDESDGCSFWMTNVYYEETLHGTWKTRVGATRFATCGPTEAGTIAGRVTTRNDGAPVAGVTIRAERGNGDVFETKTDEAGAYAILLPTGTYSVTAWAFGFLAETKAGLKVANETATTVNFRMRGANRVDVDGFVTDGSGAGWPIHAAIVITTGGTDPLVLHTDPTNGYYVAEDLPANMAYTFTVTALTPTGYMPEERKIITSAGDRQQNFALLVDETCTTPGYALGDALVTEDFGATFPPEGWRVINGEDQCFDELGTPGWNTENLIGRKNLTGGSGLFAIADPEACDNLMDTNLVAPELDLSNLGENDVIRISWNQDLLNTVDINEARLEAWDGAEWMTVADFVLNDRGPARRHVITTIGAGLTNAKFRWHHGTSGVPQWWQVDDVEVRAGSCRFPGSGGIIFGNVYDANTGDGVNGARVEADTGVVVSTVATPDDPTLDDGFYSLFVPLAQQSAAPGVRTLTVTAPGYTASSRGVIPRPASTERETFELAAGMLTVEPVALRARVPIGGTASQTLTLSNIGTAALDFDIQEVTFPPPDRRNRRPASTDATLADAGQWVTQFPTNLPGGFGVAWYPPRNTLWITNRDSGDGDNRCYELEPDGTMTGNSIDCDFEGASSGDLTYNPITETLWVVNVNYDIPAENCLYEIDPVALEQTGNRICGPWVYTQDAVAYDPASDTYYVGGDRIWQIKPDGTVVRSIITDISPYGLAYNAETQHLFVRGFGSDGQLVHVLDAADPNLTEIGVIELLDQSGNPIAGDARLWGLTFDCAGNLVSVSGTYQFVFVNSSGESGSFCSVDIPWFDADPPAGMVGAAVSSSVNARFNALDMAPGCQEAHLRVRNDTPYGTTVVPIGITVAFDDVPPNHFADGYIHGLAAALNSRGCGGGSFCPNDPLTRRAAARWLARAAYGADVVIPPATGEVFADVAPDTFAAGEIELLAGNGVITGCGDDPARFCPMQSISRAELAVWHLRALEGKDYTPPACRGLFGDVPCAVTGDFPFADWIEELATRVPAIACSTDPLLFCPDTPVTRGEAAIFTVGTFDLPICR